MITVVIPTYNRSKLLRRAIKSVLNQTYKHRCVLVMDNNSSDDTEEIVNQFILAGENIIYKRNEKNIGGLNNFFMGVKSVETDYYCTLGDDDFLMPKFMEEVIKGFNNPAVMFSCAKTVVVDLKKDKIFYRSKDWGPGFYEPSNSITCKMFNSHFTNTGVVFKKEVRELIGHFDMGGTDVLYNTFAAASFQFYVTNYYGAVFTIHNGSYSNFGGLSSENESRLFEMLMLTLGVVVNLKLSDEKKTLLSKLVLDYYFPILKIKNLSPDKNFIENNTEYKNDWINTKITKYDLFMGLLKILPKFFKPITLIFAKWFQSVHEKRERKWVERNWKPISIEIKSKLLMEESDISDFSVWIENKNSLK